MVEGTTGAAAGEGPGVSGAARSLRRLPKAHLHLHLDGSYPRAAVEALARKRGVPFSVPERFEDVWQFFAAYGEVPKLVETHEDLAALCRALVEAEAGEGVVYMEPAIEPQLYAPRLGSLGEVTRTMLSAFAEAARDHDVEVGAMLTINTDEDLAIAGKGITALGTAGFVEPAGLGRFRRAAGIARAAALPIVSHAGQTGGADSIAEALDELGATRISHGFRAVESVDLVHRMADARVCCDMCPVSNQRLGLVPDLARHPAPRLIAEGVPVTLNADDPLWFGAGITAQYEIARTEWGLAGPGIAEFARAGALAAGMSLATRQRLLDGIDAWLAGDAGAGETA